MVDPQPAGVPHIGAHQLDKAAIGLLAQRARVERRQPPSLAGRIEDVRRRADLGARHHRRVVDPGLGAGPVGADRKIAVQADRHAAFAGRRRRGAELIVGDPLQPGEKLQPNPVRLGEAAHVGRGRIAIRLGPGMPVGPIRVARGEMLAQREKQAVAPQHLALLALEPLESLPAGPVGAGAAGFEQLLQHRQFQRGDPGVIDQRLVAAGFQLLAKRSGLDQPARLFALGAAPASRSRRCSGR